MKKLFILIALMALMTTMVMAQIEPTITDIGNIGQTSYADAACWSDGVDIYCAGGDEDNLFRKYDISAGTWTETGFNTGAYSPVVENGDGCIYYQNVAYCPEQSTNGAIIYRINGLGTSSGYTSSPEFNVGQRLYPRCDLRPGTDEIWCWSAHEANESVYNVVFYLDISSNTWTNVANVNFEPDTQGLQSHRCVFVNENEFWCIAGRNVIPPTEFYNNIMVFDIAANTSDQTKTFDAMTGTSHQCWTMIDANGDNIIYCTAQYDDANDPGDLITDNIYWYNPYTDANGVLSTGFPYPISIPGLVQVGNEIYTFGGWVTSAWDYGQDIIKVDFPLSTVFTDDFSRDLAAWNWVSTDFPEIISGELYLPQADEIYLVSDSFDYKDGETSPIYVQFDMEMIPNWNTYGQQEYFYLIDNTDWTHGLGFDFENNYSQYAPARTSIEFFYWGETVDEQVLCVIDEPFTGWTQINMVIDRGNDRITAQVGGESCVWESMPAEIWDYTIFSLATVRGATYDNFYIGYTAPPVVEPVVEEVARSDNTAGNAIYIANIQQAKAASKKAASYNPIEQFILNLRAAILRLFGHEVN